MSGAGGDNFALGAVMHNTDKNSKDSPGALDEQQLLTVESWSLYEVHNVSIAGSGLGGSFTLALGGKTSRPIPAGATEAVMAAAVRELLSNCKGQNGDELDAGGNTFDCWQGLGIEYRGLASTTVSGKTCVNWRLTPIWHPSLAISAGLTRNLCRNPTLDSTLGPWCYNSQMVKEACAVPRCGGTVDVSLLATFEDEEDAGLARTNAWDFLSGVVPTIARDQAFCGQNSLYMPNSYSQARLQWQKVAGRQSQMFPYALSDYPYVCFAYLIPPGSQVSLQLGFLNPGEAEYWATSWGTLAMTNLQTPWWAPEVGRFSIVQDGQWHYTCLNVQNSATGKTRVNYVRVWADGQAISKYAQNPFWIDEFSIAKTARNVQQTAYPQLNAISKLVSVKKFNSSGWSSWSISITSATCDVPNLQFAMDTSSITGLMTSAGVTRIQEHSPPMGGFLDVSFMGQGTRFGPYSEASFVQQQMRNLSSVRGARVKRAGNCQSGFSWLISFTDVPGDLPLIEASALSLDGKLLNATVYIDTVTNGGILIAPLPADYFRVPAAALQVNTWVNDGAARCNATNGCEFFFTGSLTPAIRTAQSQDADGSTMYPTYTITGEKLDSISSNQSEPAIVLISQQDCRVLEASASELKCILSGPMSAGMHQVSVNVPGRGWAQGNLTVSYPLHIASIQPSSISAVWPTILRLLGFGFNPDDLQSNKIKIDVDSSLSLDCSPLNASTYELFCVVNPENCGQYQSKCASRRLLDSSSLTVSASVQVGNIQFSVANSLQLLPITLPAVSSVLPSQGSGGGGIRITVNGINFSPECSKNSVFMGATRCPISSCTTTCIYCILSPSVSSLTNVTVYVDGVGISEPSDQSIFQYLFNINHVAPALVGLGGGSLVTVTGDGLMTSNGEKANISLAFPGWEIFVVRWVNFFFLDLDGKSSALLPRDVNKYIVEAEIQSLLSRGSVRVNRNDLPDKSVSFSIEFRGNQGPVSLVIGAGCNSSATQDTISATCEQNEGVNSTMITPGKMPAGFFALSMSGPPVSLQVFLNSSAAMLQSAMSIFNIPDGVAVTRADSSLGTDWTITFNSVQDRNYLFKVDSSGLSGGVVSVTRIRDGSTPLTGKWAISLSGVSTRWLQVNATEADVLGAIQDKISMWDDVLSVDVTQGDNIPGPFINRDYPRQWAIKLQRQHALGNGKERCTNPLYVDWDPTACPTSAPDLFLAYFPYYWPALMPRPTDLESDAYITAWQKSCDSEALALNLVPTVCEALRPVETRPYCGVGSGINPPCWITRFTTAKVLHRNGDQVIYVVNNVKFPTESEKGFGFWQREDYLNAQQNQTLMLNASISNYGAEMTIRSLDSVSGTKTVFNTTTVNSSVMIVSLASLFQQVPSYSDLLRMDVFSQPMLIWRHGNAWYNGSESIVQSFNVQSKDGIMASGQASTFSATAAVLIPLDPVAILSEFTADFWVRVDINTIKPKTCSLVIRMVGSQGIVCALAICRSSTILKPTLKLWTNRSTAGDSSTYSCIDAALDYSDGWTHIAVGIKGRLQRLYIDGDLVQETVFDTSIPSFEIGKVVLSSGCDVLCSRFKDLCNVDSACNVRASVWLNQIGAGFQVLPFAGDIDWVLVYAVLLSPSIISTHSQAISRMYPLAVQANFGQTVSTCESGNCTISASFDTTPEILRIEPSVGSPGIQITVFGRNILDSTPSVRIGAESCAVIAASQSTILCNVSETQALGLMPVSILLESYGESAKFLYTISPYIFAVLPADGGNILGGTNMTIVGSGFAYQDPSNIEITVGESECKVLSVQPSAIVCEIGRRGIPYMSSVLVSKVLVSFDSILAVSQCNSSATVQAAMALQNSSIDSNSTNLSTIASSCPSPFLLQKASDLEYIPSAYGVRHDTSCLFTFSTVALPSIFSVFPMLVKQNTVLQISGSRLVDEAPIIRIGACRCPVVNITATEVSCTVQNCEGCEQRLSIQCETGFALNTQSSDCDDIEIIYVPSISSFIPSIGSAWGDFVVTILGSGFSSTAERNNILIGNLKVNVLEARTDTIIAKVPVNNLWSNTQAGLERAVLFFEMCADSSVCNKSDINGALQTCSPYSGIPARQNTSFNTTRILVDPPSLDDNLFLVDSDPRTVWRSKPGVDKVLIGIDLNQVQMLSSVKLLWAENTSAAQYQVTLASSCDGPGKIFNRSLCWPYAEARNLARSCGVNGQSACLASQSLAPTNYKLAVAAGGVDGVREQVTWTTAASCVEVPPMSLVSGCPTWWRVDLNSSRSVGGGKIFNRWDTAGENLAGFQVWIGDGADFGNRTNTLCFTSRNDPLSLFVDAFSLPFTCVGKGRYLFVSTPRCSTFSFCEVEIYPGVPECSLPAWNQVDEIIFDKGTQAKFVSVQLLQRRPGEAGYKLRGIEIRGTPATAAQQVYLSVNSIMASCDVSCNISLVNVTEIHSIEPLSGITGQQITIRGSGFDPTCSENKVMIGDSACESITCLDTAVQCTVPELDPAAYSVYLNTRLGRASGLLSFSSYLAIASISPTAAGLGGASSLQIQGSSMACMGCDNYANVSLCGVPAQVLRANSNRSLLTVTIPAVSDLPPASQPSSFVSLASEDALEYAVPFCYNYSVANNIRYCYCEDADWMCFRSRYFPGMPSATIMDMIHQYRYSDPIMGRTIWQCSCIGKTGTVISDGYTLGFDLIQGSSLYSAWSPQAVYLRFQGLGVAYNSSVLSARLRVFPSDTTCTATSIIRIWAESSADSPTFNPYRRGALSARVRTTSYVDWNVAGWKWAYRQEESVDISPVLNEVIQKQGWRSGNSLTLILRQQVTAGGGPCQFLSSDAGTNYTPSIQVAVLDSLNATTFKNDPVRCDLKLDVALSSKASISAQSLVSCDDVLTVTDSRKFLTMSINTPYTGPVSVVPGIACCSSVGHPAYHALDSDQSTFWRSPPGYRANFNVDLGESGAVVSRLSILWTSEFAPNYTVLAWIAGSSWFEIYNKVNGDGGIDEFEVQSLSPKRRISSLRIQMTSNVSDPSQVTFGIVEIVVYGCAQLANATSASATKTQPNAVQLLKSLSPSIIGVSPSRGSTAGGGMVNVTGIFGTQLSSQLSVDFGGLPCAIRSLLTVDASTQTITCTPYASVH